MGRRRITDYQIMMVLSQKLQRYLARVLAFSGIYKFCAFVVQRLICSENCEILSRESIENLYFARFLRVHKHPPLEIKWVHVGKVQWILPLILQPRLGKCKVLT